MERGEDQLLLFLRIADVTDSVQVGPRDDVLVVVVVVVHVHVIIAVAAEVDEVLIVFAVVTS